MCDGMDVLKTACALCHMKNSPIAPLDLVSEDTDLFGRMGGIPVKNAMFCMGQPLVSPTLGPDGKAAGVFIDRLTGTKCGPLMPLTGMLPQPQIDCIRDWLTAKVKANAAK